MDDKRSAVERLGGLEGADSAALGLDPPPEPAPADAQAPDDVRLVPGAGFDDTPNDQVKPWFTSLAAKSEQAGVGNDPVDEQEPRYPDRDDPH